MIRTLPARYPELGRIRLGEKGNKGEPVKGKFLRFSSNDELVLRAVASQLGGTVEPWAGGEQAYHLTTESDSVDVYLPPNPIDTSYERWGKGGCNRRCDGERATFLARGPDGEFMDTGDCLCLAEGRVPGDRKDDDACNVTVRLRLVLPEVPGVGVWVCTSHSVYAAMELPAQINILASLMGEGAGLLPATFAIDHREEKKPYERFPRRYSVPVLRVRQSLRQLAEAARSNGEELAAPPGHAALDAGAPVPPTATHTEGAGVDAAGGKGYARTADAHSEAGEAHAPDHSRAEPAAEPIPAQRGGSRAGRQAVGAPAGSPPPEDSPFLRVIRTRARTLGYDEAELNYIVQQATGRATLSDITGPAEANKVMAVLAK